VPDLSLSVKLKAITDASCDFAVFSIARRAENFAWNYFPKMKSTKTIYSQSTPYSIVFHYGIRHRVVPIENHLILVAYPVIS
jgi:hypothetical protein